MCVHHANSNRYRPVAELDKNVMHDVHDFQGSTHQLATVLQVIQDLFTKTNIYESKSFPRDPVAS